MYVLRYLFKSMDLMMTWSNTIANLQALTLLGMFLKSVRCSFLKILHSMFQSKKYRNLNGKTNGEINISRKGLIHCLSPFSK